MGAEKDQALDWRLHSVEILQTSWYSKAFNCHFFMMKRWRYVYFAALLFWKVRFCANCQGWEQQEVKIELLVLLFLTQGLLFFWSLISQLDLMLPRQRACVGTVLFHRWNLSSHSSHFSQRYKNIYSSLCCYRQLNLKPKCSKITFKEPKMFSTNSVTVKI